MNLDTIIDLWSQHYIIGSIIGIIVIAFVYEVYTLPFRINEYLDMRMEEIERKEEHDKEIRNIITCLMLQQHYRFKSNTSEDYLKEIERINEEIKESINCE